MLRPLYALLLTPVLALAGCDALAGLPAGLQVKDAGPRTYRFVCDYTHLDTKGNLVSIKRISADYTRGLPEGKARWDHVTIATTAVPGGPFQPPAKQEYMDGFSYRLADAQKKMLEPEFFPGFPPTAFEARNLVWDAHMFESFGQDFFDKLKLNVPYHQGPGTADLAGTGQFENKDVELTWVGISRRNGQECAVIRYDSYFNKLKMNSPGLDMVGRSHYWGDIWVSLTTKQIEYATLYEDVLSELKLATQPMMIVNVFRRGTFAPQ
jgi:hypothetical protein